MDEEFNEYLTDLLEEFWYLPPDLIIGLLEFDGAAFTLGYREDGDPAVVEFELDYYGNDPRWS